MRVRASTPRMGLLTAAAFTLACGGGLPPSDVPRSELPPGDHTIDLRFGGRTRAYIAHVPPGRGGPLPVVLAFHGGGGEARGFQAYAGLDAVADRENVVVVYPYGSGRMPRRLLTWNAGDCCGFAMDHAVDDVGFAIAVLDDLAGRAPIDARRVYATGHSNGAMMAYRLAAERADRIAAVAAVAGAMNVDAFAPARPVPVLHVHSVDDPRAPYDGGEGPAFPGTDIVSAHRPVEEGLARWRAANGCADTAHEVETRTGAAGSADAGQTAALLVWEPCVGGATVALWRLTGVGHGWPGHRATADREEIIGPGTELILAAEEAWRFFEGEIQETHYRR